MTNNSLQQNSKSTRVYDEQNCFAFELLQKYIDDNFKNRTIDVQTDIIPRIKDIMIDCLLATKHKLKIHRKNSFELYVFDFVIDEDLRIWLVEVKSNPNLNFFNSYLMNFLPKLIDDVLSITIDKTFVPLIENFYFKDREQLFDLIFSESKSINERRSFDNKYIYPICELIPKVTFLYNNEEHERIKKLDLRYKSIETEFDNIVQVNKELRLEMIKEITSDCFKSISYLKKLNPKSVENVNKVE